MTRREHGKHPRLRLGRRAFLGSAAAAAATAGLPWLEWFSNGASAQPAVPPLRFVLVSVGHSLHVSRSSSPEWVPTSGPGPLGTLPALLDPLTPYRDRMTVVEGIDNLVVRLVSTNGHNGSSRTLFTCMPHAEALDSGGNLRAGAPELDWASGAGGPSVEWVMADALGAVPLGLRVGEHNTEHRRSFRLDGTDDPGEPNPRAAFDRLFAGRTGETATPSPREQLARRRGTILRSVQDAYRSLATRVGREDRLRLEAHADLIRDVEMELDRTVDVVCSDPTLDTSGLPSDFGDGNGRYDDVIASAQNSLIATSLACRATPVVALHYSNMQNNKFPWLAGGSDFISEGWHAVTHMDTGTDDDRLRPMRWYSEILRDLLDKLAAVPEGDGTLLDNTVVAFVSSLSNNAHGTNNLPVILFGGPGGPLVTGRFVSYRDDRRSLADLWITLLNAMGVSRTTFGWDRGSDPHEGRPFVTGPLTELLA